MDHDIGVLVVSIIKSKVSCLVWQSPVNWPFLHMFEQAQELPWTGA